MSLRALAWVICIVYLVGVRVGAKGDGGMRAKTVAHADGSYTEVITDEEEMISRVTTFDATGKVLGKMLNRLGSNFEPLKSYTYDPAGKPLYWTELKHDSKGRVREAIEYTPRNQFIRRMVFSYDTAGKLANVRTFDSKGHEIVVPKKH